MRLLGWRRKTHTYDPLHTIDADTKLIPSWYIGDRSGQSAWEFLTDLRSHLANRIQLTSDGHKAYLIGVAGSFGDMDQRWTDFTRVSQKPQEMIAAGFEFIGRKPIAK